MMDSFVEIELFQNNAYVAGQPVYGTVHLFAKNNINNVSKINLSLVGNELVDLRFKVSKDGEAVSKEETIVDHQF